MLGTPKKGTTCLTFPSVFESTLITVSPSNMSSEVRSHIILSAAKNLSFHFELKMKKDSSLRSE